MSSSQSRSLEALSIAIAAEERTIREGGGRAASVGPGPPAVDTAASGAGAG